MKNPFLFLGQKIIKIIIIVVADDKKDEKNCFNKLKNHLRNFFWSLEFSWAFPTDNGDVDVKQFTLLFWPLACGTDKDVSSVYALKFNSSWEILILFMTKIKITSKGRNNNVKEGNQAKKNKKASKILKKRMKYKKTERRRRKKNKN